MKKTRLKFRKITLCAMIAVLSVLCFGALHTSAEEQPNVQPTEQHIPTTAKLDEMNVALNGKMHLVFTVADTVVTPDDAILGIAVWDGDVENPSLENCKYVNFNKKSQNGYTYYKTRPFGLSEIGNSIYVAACYKTDGKVVIGQNPKKFSVAEYFISGLTKPISSDLASVYSGYLELATELGADAFTTVKTNGGYVGYNQLSYGGSLGDTVLLRADAKNNEGEYFLCWKDSTGAVVSHDRLFNVKVEKEGITEYTAVYGDVEMSKYRATVDFESMELGKIAFNYPAEDATDKILYGYNSAKTPLLSATRTFNDFGISMSSYISLVSVGDNQFVYGDAHDFIVVDSPKGGKALTITNGHQGRGMASYFNDIYDAYAVGAEVDIKYDTCVSGGFFHVTLSLKDKDGKTISLRTNISTNGNTATFYAEGDTNHPHVYFLNKVDLVSGNVLSLRFDLDREAEALDFYVNGVLLEKVPLTAYATYAVKLEAAEAESAESGETVEAFDTESFVISRIAVIGISSTKDDITVDNVSFICGEPIIDEEEEEESEEVTE